MKNRNVVIENKADKGIRFVNYLIDIIINNVTVYLFMMIIGIILYLIGREDIIDDIAEINPLLDMLLTWIMISILYFFTEYITGGRTVGKFITGTIVVNENGTKPDMETFLKRNFCRIIPFNAFSFLGERGWHDSISRTTVVNKKAFENSLNLSEELNQIGVNPE